MGRDANQAITASFDPVLNALRVDGAAGPAGADGAAGASTLAFNQIGSTINNYYLPGAVGSGTLGVISPVLNTLYAIPHVVGRSGTIDRLKYLVNSGQSGNARVGVYSNTGSTDLYPNALLFGSGSAVVTAAENTITVSPALALTAGALYWFVFFCSANIGSVSAVAVGDFYAILGINGAFNGAPQIGWTRAFAFAALPDPFGAGGTRFTTAMPALGMRFAT